MWCLNNTELRFESQPAALPSANLRRLRHHLLLQGSGYPDKAAVPPTASVSTSEATLYPQSGWRAWRCQPTTFSPIHPLGKLANLTGQLERLELAEYTHIVIQGSIGTSKALIWSTLYELLQHNIPSNYKAQHITDTVPALSAFRFEAALFLSSDYRPSAPPWLTLIHRLLP